MALGGLGSVGSLFIELRASTDKLAKDMQGGLKGLERQSAQMRKIGMGLTAAVTLPIAGIAVAAIKAFDEEAKAIAQVETAIETTGNAAGFSSIELQKMAADLQQVSLFGNEKILAESIAQFQTFTNIAGPEFSRAIQASMDVATRTQQDLKSTAIQLGKALNDPIANLGALGRTGIQFSEDQKELIKSLADTGRLSEAQAIILSELETQYGGSAAAAAAAGTGGFTQLKNSIGDLLEEFGKLITNGINPIVKPLQNTVKAFSGLDDQTKKYIVTAGLIAAAIGPVLLGLGLIVPALTAVMTGLAFFTGPVGIIAVVIAALVTFVATNETVQTTLKNVWEDLQILWEVFSFNFQDELQIIKTVFQAVWGTVVIILETAFGVLGGALTAFTGLATGDWKRFAAGIEAIWDALWSAIKRIMTAPIDAIKNTVKGFTDGVTGFFSGMYDKVVGQSIIPDLMRDIKSEFGRLDTEINPAVETSVGGIGGIFGGLTDKITGPGGLISGALDPLFSKFESFSSLIPGFDSITGAFDSITGAVNRVSDSISGVLSGGGGAAGAVSGGVGLTGGLIAGVGGILGGIATGLMQKKAFGIISGGVDEIKNALNTYIETWFRQINPGLQDKLFEIQLNTDPIPDMLSSLENSEEWQGDLLSAVKGVMRAVERQDTTVRVEIDKKVLAEAVSEASDEAGQFMPFQDTQLARATG